MPPSGSVIARHSSGAWTDIQANTHSYTLKRNHRWIDSKQARPQTQTLACLWLLGAGIKGVLKMGAYSVAQAGLNLATTFLSLLLKCWNCRPQPPYPAWSLLFIMYIHRQMCHGLLSGVGSLLPQCGSTQDCKTPQQSLYLLSHLKGTTVVVFF